MKLEKKNLRLQKKIPTLISSHRVISLTFKVPLDI